jgi:serine/threonine protein phosphatase PrpC
MNWWKTKRTYAVEVGAYSDVGQVRSENQDAYGRFPAVADQETGERLFIVADGMGGHARGGEASRLAVDVLQETFFAGDDGAVGERLERAFEAANLRVYALGHTGPTQTITGTTCTVIALVDGHLHMAHVGDSRAYRIDKHGIEQLTRDHTLVEELRRQGMLTDDEARTHPRRHALTRALGIQPTLEVDVLEARPVEAAQHYLLCSDGLAPVSEEEIRQVVLTYPPQQACEHLVEMANQRGGPDNVTVLIVAINRS